jgi:hypothetical protein
LKATSKSLELQVKGEFDVVSDFLLVNLDAHTFLLLAHKGLKLGVFSIYYAVGSSLKKVPNR